MLFFVLGRFGGGSGFHIIPAGGAKFVMEHESPGIAALRARNI